MINRCDADIIISAFVDYIVSADSLVYKSTATGDQIILKT